MALPSKFKSVTVNQDLSVNIDEIPLPVPKGDELLVRIVCSGVNPKDWKLPHAGMSKNSGDDIAGYVAAVGPDVREFRVGDRVTGFHVMMAAYGSFGEYGILHEFLTFHIPRNVSFQEASTIPLAALTAALGLFIQLELPTPWHPAPEGSSNPLIIWGASAAVGAFAVKLAKAANISPIIAICGAGAPYVKTLGVDCILDYRTDNLASQLQNFLGDQKCYNLFDAVGGEENWVRMNDLVEECGAMTSALPHDVELMKKSMPKIKVSETFCSRMQPPPEEGDTVGLERWGDVKHFGYVATKSIGKLLEEGRFSGHPIREVEGLEGIERALKELKDGKASAVKYVINIAKE